MPAPAEAARRRPGTESLHHHRGGLAKEMGMPYFSKEVQLTKKHEEILAQRLQLLQEMEDRNNQKAEKKAAHLKSANLAFKRNQSLLNDIRTLEEKFEKKIYSQSSPEIDHLQTLYWASVEEQAPKWVQFLLGRTQHPIGVRDQNPAGNDIKDTER
ncbi:centrosomal protein 15 isoform X3 [Macrotis lagotis]|uniref:centrosomal protein 15 isoform X3 n=1 Tax=Macrotis lagotis TaxID=92651 RepID=UPI003D699F6B